MALVEKLQEKLLEFRLHALLLAALAALVLGLLRLGPSFLTIVNFFWPLLLSTALCLAAVLVLRLISPPPAGGPSDPAGEELMDYVAGPARPVEHGREAERGRENEAPRAVEAKKSQ